MKYLWSSHTLFVTLSNVSYKVILCLEIYIASYTWECWHQRCRLHGWFININHTRLCTHYIFYIYAKFTFRYFSGCLKKTKLVNQNFSSPWNRWGMVETNNKYHKQKCLREAAWLSGLGCWIWYLEVPGSNLPPCYYLDLFSVVSSSTPQLRYVNNKLVRLPPVGILKLYLLYKHQCFIRISATEKIHIFSHVKLR